jgi:DUF1680 family protein
MQAYLVNGSRKHLRAASNAFDMIEATQSFSTGAWGPNESFGDPASDFLSESLTGTHRGFETPCGSYAHFKLTRYLLRVTGDGRYGDSMERVFYNTVLGAKPLQPDGRAFYYSDYHSTGRKVYFDDAWPCCAGTLPQVTADYRILAYFRDARGVFVNLYLPSTLRLTAPDGAQMEITQTGNYPFEGGNVALRLRTSRPSSMDVRLRIPAWSTQSAIRINGEKINVSLQKGFATLRRTWKDGDRIDLALGMPVRAVPIHAKHPETVSLMRGPVVLFAIGEHPPVFTRQQLIAEASNEAKFRPFIAIHDETYSTYVKVA